jgi:hypothetical protein
MRKGMCIGYLSAVFHSALANKLACPPERVTVANGVLEAVFIRWIAENPKAMTLPWLTASSYAFMATWPCADPRTEHM